MLFVPAIFATASFAADPILNHISPAAGQQGTTVSVSVAGKFDPWPVQAWVDAPGITFKPAKTAGKFDVEIAKDAAPGPHLVRLFNETGASAPRFFIVARGKKTPVELVGWNLTSTHAEIDGTNFPAEATTAELALPDITSDLPVMVSGIPEILGVKPDSHAATAQTVAVPTGITGCITRPGEEDRFAFTAVKGRAYEFKVNSAALGSALDSWLKIENKDGKQLATNDDVNGFSDSALTWTAPADGTFTCAIGDVAHHGGDNYFYRLAITEAAPSVAATITVHSANIVAGKTSELKVAVKRANAFKSKLQLVAKNLPDGITATPVDVPEKDGEVTLKLIADADAKPAGQACTLVLRETDSGAEHPARFSLLAGSENNGVPQGYTELIINSTEHLWLTVLPPSAKPEPPKPAEKK